MRLIVRASILIIVLVEISEEETKEQQYYFTKNIYIFETAKSRLFLYLQYATIVE